MSEFLMKAKLWDGMTRFPHNALVSEKLDGMRCLWDGGITRGMKAKDVMWANTVKTGGEHVSTGLWSDGGKVIFAPDWWVETLPPVALDGELWLGRKCFQSLCSIVRSHTPDDRWKTVRFMVFDSPTADRLCQIRQVEMSKGCKVVVFPRSVTDMTKSKIRSLADGTFEHTYAHMLDVAREYYDRKTYWYVLPQTPLYDLHWQAYITGLIKGGAEGAVVRSADSIWTPERRKDVWKVKPEIDDEGVIIGWEPGKGRLEGMMGSVTVKWAGKEKVFQLSGFTDEERRRDWDCMIGKTITFKYRELTDAGIPKEARYHRVREDRT